MQRSVEDGSRCEGSTLPKYQEERSRQKKLSLVQSDGNKVTEARISITNEHRGEWKGSTLPRSQYDEIKKKRWTLPEKIHYAPKL